MIFGISHAPFDASSGKADFVNQAKAQETMIAALIGYTITPDETKVFLGGSFRTSTMDWMVVRLLH